MSEDRLSARKKQILKAIVDAHIAYGEPVGSKYLASDKQLTCSSATIRNEMAELEAMGYLEQPHTSAGRVPSELGYRFYVDSLLQRYSMTVGEIERINLNLRHKLSELDQILSEASRLASNLTNYTAIAVKPRQSAVAVTRFECVRLGEHDLILVLLFGSTVKTKNVHLPAALPESAQTLLLAALNESLVGVTVEQINIQRIMELERRMGEYAFAVDPVIKAVYAVIRELDGGDLKVEGLNHLLEYPEYADVGRLQRLLGSIENKDDILNLIPTDASSDDVNIYIGNEDGPDGMQKSAFVYRTVKDGDRVVGAIGVIGPCRMDYSKVIATVNQLAEDVNEMLNLSEPKKIEGPKE
ncbi:MAG: heat-inducible transcription repressor HrcA [Clostridia bacterium]|nr:heat-inducible transcription repressor HrcA [Clostridia bacterium]